MVSVETRYPFRFEHRNHRAVNADSVFIPKRRRPSRCMPAVTLFCVTQRPATRLGQRSAASVPTSVNPALRYQYRPGTPLPMWTQRPATTVDPANLYYCGLGAPLPLLTQRSASTMDPALRCGFSAPLLLDPPLCCHCGHNAPLPLWTLRFATTLHPAFRHHSGPNAPSPPCAPLPLWTQGSATTADPAFR